MNEVMSRYSE